MKTQADRPTICVHARTQRKMLRLSPPGEVLTVNTIFSPEQTECHFASGISTAISSGTARSQLPVARSVVSPSFWPSLLPPLPSARPTSPILLDVGQPHLLQGLRRHSPQMNSHRMGQIRSLLPHRLSNTIQKVLVGSIAQVERGSHCAPPTASAAWGEGWDEAQWLPPEEEEVCTFPVPSSFIHQSKSSGHLSFRGDPTGSPRIQAITLPWDGGHYHHMLLPGGLPGQRKRSLLGVGVKGSGGLLGQPGVWGLLGQPG